MTEMSATITGTTRFNDGPGTYDAADVLFVVPANTQAELRPGPGGTTLVCKTADAKPSAPTVEEITRRNAEFFRRLRVSAGAPQ